MSVENDLRAVIEILGPTLRPGEEFGYRIKNTGSVDLICGLPYRLERETVDGWVLMNRDMAFRLVGFGVTPGQHRELKATIPMDAPDGPYRISTTVSSDHVQGSIRLAAQFDVRRDE